MITDLILSMCVTQPSKYLLVSSCQPGLQFFFSVTCHFYFIKNPLLLFSLSPCSQFSSCSFLHEAEEWTVIGLINVTGCEEDQHLKNINYRFGTIGQGPFWLNPRWHCGGESNTLQLHLRHLAPQSRGQSWELPEHAPWIFCVAEKRL